MITMEHVCKSYKVAKRKAGLGEACKSLLRREHEIVHALKDVSFSRRRWDLYTQPFHPR